MHSFAQGHAGVTKALGTDSAAGPRADLLICNAHGQRVSGFSQLAEIMWHHYYYYYYYNNIDYNQIIFHRRGYIKNNGFVFISYRRV